jgi:hypothetical protein
VTIGGITKYYTGPDGTGSVVPGLLASTQAAAVSAAFAPSPDTVSTFSGSGQSLDPSPGNHTIQFISGATSDTLVLHLAGSDQVLGFDPAAGDMLDLRSLLGEAQVGIRDISQLGNYISIADIGGSASIAFDPTGHGGGSQVALLVNGGGLVAQLQTLKAFIS